MHICIISEGSYPYVPGGVSSWTQMLINSMPEHKFTVVAIYPEKKMRGKFKYDFPENLIEVRENFLDELSEKKGVYSRSYRDMKVGLTQFARIIRGKSIQWDKFFGFLKKNEDKSAQDFVMSKPFYDGLIKAYEESYDTSCLSDYFWTVRSISLPLVSLMKVDMPEADIYHSLCTGYAGILAVKAKLEHKKPVLLTEHGIYTREREEEIIRSDWVSVHFKEMWIKYFYSLSQCIYQYADKSVTLFDAARKIQQEIGCDSEKQLVISNGVDVEKYGKLKKKKLEGKLVVGAIVRVVPIKDILTMIQAFHMVNQYIENVHFFLMGPYEESPEYFDECKSVCRLLNLDDVVEFTGRININDYMPYLDVAVLSSISEGQPLSVLETMAAGIPNVTTDVGSCREILCESKNDDFGDAGIVVPVMDYKKLAKGIIQILQDEKLRQNMGEAAQKRVQKSYRLEDTVRQYKKLYIDLIKEEG